MKRFASRGLFFILLAPMCATASNWTQVTEVNDATYSIDTDRINYRGQNPRAWSRSDFNKPSASGALSSVSLVEYDCDAMRYRIHFTTEYSRSGKSLGSDNVPTDWDYVMPDSVIEALAKHVCENRPS